MRALSSHLHLPLAALGCLGLAASPASALTPEEHLTAQIEWIESKGGYYSSKIEYRNLVRDDPSSPLGMFLAEDVDRDEILMLIPKECVLTSGVENVTEGDASAETKTATCDTVKRLAKEHQLGKLSEFYPYVRYVFDPRHDGDLPAEWSDEGIELLEAIAGEELFGEPAYDIEGLTYEGECGAKAVGATELEKKAYLHVLRRSWDDKMLPVYDMVNHRNPPYKNVDSNSPHTGEDVHVVALRDIRAGEQLFLSYNECTDCKYTDDYAYSYTLQHLLRDYGFVEPYPQRWQFFGGEMRFQIEEKVPDFLPGEKSEEEALYVGSGSPLKLTWLNANGTLKEDYLDEEMMHYLYGHLRKLKDLPVEEMSKGLRPHEAYTALQFHAALVRALQHVIWYAVDLDDDLKVGGTASQPVTYGVGTFGVSIPELWTSDNEPAYAATLHFRTCSDTYLDGILHRGVDTSVWETSTTNLADVLAAKSDRFDLLDAIQSFYQVITFWESNESDPEKRDVCMKIELNWESCQSNRPHYHEVLAHYPASYVPEVKRVMFLGGGDGMILAELVKYKSLELVVGMELDKGVLQASFLYFETLPHFDDERVEWWFGDAAKSMKLLPEEYLGTFDIIYVDMQNYIVNALNIMEQVSRYAHPQHGIVMRNEDAGFGTNVPFALHNIDLYDGDVPIFCHQAITMGSNVTDFFTAPRYAHDVSNLYYDPSEALDESTRFSRWYNYRKADEFGGGGGTGLLETPSAGIFVVLDLEEVSADKISVDEISSALKSAGVPPLETKTYRGASSANDVMVFLVEEGYVVARAFPGQKYCAIDIMLGSNYDKMYGLERSLASTLESGVKSSYRIVTGASLNKQSKGYVKGMYDSVMGRVFGSAGDTGSGEAGVQADEAPSCNEGDAGSGCEDAHPEAKQVDPASHVNGALATAVSSLVSVESSMEIMILCGEKSQPCGAWDVAQSAGFSLAATLTRVNACPEAESIFACESKLRSSIRDMARRGNKIDAILVDAFVPKRSGHVLHRVFDRAEFRGHALSDAVVVASVTTNWASMSWFRILLERFRTEFFPYNPSFHAEVLFHLPGKDSDEGLGASIYSAGNAKFYADFLGAVEDTAATTGLSSDVRYVLDGLNNLEPDFSPTKQFARGDYDNKIAAREQYKSQKPVGRQTVEQYDVGTPSEVSLDKIKSSLESALSLVGVEKGSYEMMVHQPVSGGGVVVLALWDEGDASVIYDGASQMDLTLFTLSQDVDQDKDVFTTKDEDVHNTFEQQFAKAMPSLAHKLADVQLRGTGRVVAIIRSQDVIV